MPYQLIITKRRFWADRNGKVIEHVTWENYVNESSRTRWQDINQLSGYLTKKHFRTQAKKFHWCDGRIHVDGADDGAVRAALIVAEQLKAIVQGVFGEIYYLDPAGAVRYVWPDLGLPDPAIYYQAFAKKERHFRRVIIPLIVVMGLLGGLLKASYDDRANPRRPAPPPAQTFDFVTHVEKGEAGEAFQRLFPEAHARYLERAAQGDPWISRCPFRLDLYRLQLSARQPG